MSTSSTWHRSQAHQRRQYVLDVRELSATLSNVSDVNRHGTVRQNAKRKIGKITNQTARHKAANPTKLPRNWTTSSYLIPATTIITTTKISTIIIPTKIPKYKKYNFYTFYKFIQLLQSLQLIQITKNPNITNNTSISNQNSDTPPTAFPSMQEGKRNKERSYKTLRA